MSELPGFSPWLVVSTELRDAATRAEGSPTGSLSPAGHRIPRTANPLLQIGRHPSRNADTVVLVSQHQSHSPRSKAHD